MPASIAWDGGAGTLNWSDVANWSNDTLPGAGDDVTIDELGVVKILTGETVVINSLTSAGTLDIADGTFSFATTANCAGLTMSSGEVTANGTLSISSAFDRTGGIIEGSGRVVLELSATGVIGGNSGHEFGTLLENAGTLTHAGGDLYLGTATAAGVLRSLAGATLILDAGRPIWASAGVGNLLDNLGTIEHAYDETTFIDVHFENAGSIILHQGTLDLRGNATGLHFDGMSYLQSQLESRLSRSQSLTGTTSNASLFSHLGTTAFSGGTVEAPLMLELMGNTVGPTPLGYNLNFAHRALELESAYVRLIDSANNAPGNAAEALYVDTLVVPADSTLDLNQLKVYARVAQIDGTVVGGTVEIVPDGGPFALNNSATGTIASGGEMDEWTFFGRVGQAVTLLANPGQDGSLPPVAPTLGEVDVQVIDAAGNVLASGVSPAPGGLVSLIGVELPRDEVYRIRVRSTPAQPNATGHYLLTVYDATIETRPLVFTQDELGVIDTPFATDRWVFTASVNEQIRLDLISTASAAIRFKLSGPNGWIKFSGLPGECRAFRGRPNIPEVLQPTASATVGKVLVERLPYAKPLGWTGNAFDEVEGIEGSVRAGGLRPGDVNMGNVGRDASGKLTVFDPGDFDKLARGGAVGFASGGAALQKTAAFNQGDIKSILKEFSASTGIPLKSLVSGVSVVDNLAAAGNARARGKYIAGSKRLFLSTSNIHDRGTLRGVIFHELGHSVDRLIGEQSGMKGIASRGNNSIRAYGEVYGKRLSSSLDPARYDKELRSHAAKPSEGFAETVAEVVSGRGRRGSVLSDVERNHFKAKVLDRVAASQNWGFIKTADAARERVKKQQRRGLFGRFAGGGLALPVYGHTRRANQEEIIRSIRKHRADQGLGVARLEHDDALIGHTLSPDVFSRIPKGSTVAGIGSVGLALKTPEGDVVRLQSEEMVKRILARRPDLDMSYYGTTRPNISSVLQSTHSQQLGSKFLERLPFASRVPDDQVVESILKLRLKARSEGFDFMDHHSGNVGRVGGDDFVIDPGAVRPLGYYKNMMKRNRSRSTGEINSAARMRAMLASSSFGNKMELNSSLCLRPANTVPGEFREPRSGERPCPDSASDSTGAAGRDQRPTVGEPRLVHPSLLGGRIR